MEGDELIFAHCPEASTQMKKSGRSPKRIAFLSVVFIFCVFRPDICNGLQSSSRILLRSPFSSQCTRTSRNEFELSPRHFVLVLRASNEDCRDVDGRFEESWSNAVTKESNGRSSRFGVRNRVRSVLQKARNRTGIRNNSENISNKDMTGPSVVADAASIGGLGGVVVDEKGTVDVALDFVISTKASQSPNLSGMENFTEGLLAVDDGLELNGQSGGELIRAFDRNSVNGQPVSPASTWSPPSAEVRSNPEDSLTPASSTLKDKNESKSASPLKPLSEVDAFRGDVSAAFSMPPSPLPFTTPKLTLDQKELLKQGERVQFQDKMGREGSGFVVLDVKATPDVVWDCLLDFQAYPETIPTVRDVQMFTNTNLKRDYRAEKPLAYEDGTMAMLKHGVPSVTRAAFTLSKFRLKIAAIHKYRPHPQGDYMVFTLDPACTNAVLKSAKGVWYTQANPDGMGEEYTRVWLLCELRVSRLLPQWITDYAARRAMPRATTWLKPQVEAAASLWLKKPGNE